MNYGDKHTEDSLVSRLGRLYGIERGLDCGPNIIADQKKNKYHDHPDVRGFYYFVPQELYSKHKDEVKTVCKEKGAGLIVDGYPITTVLKPKVRKDVKPLSDNGYIHYLRLFAKKWVRER